MVRGGEIRYGLRDSRTVCEALLVPKRSEFSEVKGLSQPVFEMFPPYCQLVANSLATRLLWVSTLPAWPCSAACGYPDSPHALHSASPAGLSLLLLRSNSGCTADPSSNTGSPETWQTKTSSSAWKVLTVAGLPELAPMGSLTQTATMMRTTSSAPSLMTACPTRMSAPRPRTTATE